MIEFDSKSFLFGNRPVSQSCLVSDVDLIEGIETKMSMEGEEFELDENFSRNLVAAIKSCVELEPQGFGVDCSVFGVLAMGGTYEPVSDVVYRRRLTRNIVFDRWLDFGEILGEPESPKLVQFVRYTNQRAWPVHTAVQLPNRADTYIQKIGHNLPIAVDSAESIANLHGADSVVAVRSFVATDGPVCVLNFQAQANTQAEPMGTYLGLPD